MTGDELRAFVRAEVRKALEEITVDVPEAIDARARIQEEIERATPRLVELVCRRLVTGLRTQSGYYPRGMEVKNAALSGRLPAWARPGEGTGKQGR